MSDTCSTGLADEEEKKEELRLHYELPSCLCMRGKCLIHLLSMSLNWEWKEIEMTSSAQQQVLGFALCCYLFHSSSSLLLLCLAYIPLAPSLQALKMLLTTDWGWQVPYVIANECNIDVHKYWDGERVKLRALFVIQWSLCQSIDSGDLMLIWYGRTSAVDYFDLFTLLYQLSTEVSQLNSGAHSKCM